MGKHGIRAPLASYAREKTIQDSTLILFQWLVAVVHRREVVRTSGILLVNGLVISRK